MRKPTTRDLSDKHAEYIRDTFGARITKGSGNQFNDQLDNRMEKGRYSTYAFGFEGKATQARSTTLKLDDWEKGQEQVHDLYLALAHRFYVPDNRLVPVLDLITVRADDFAAILADANTYQEMRDR